MNNSIQDTHNISLADEIISHIKASTLKGTPLDEAFEYVMNVLGKYLTEDGVYKVQEEFGIYYENVE